MKIKKLLCLLSVCFCCASLSIGQSIYERIPDQGKQLSALLLGYRSNDFKIFGSASIFYVPISTNNGGTAFICAVTALHNLKDKETGDPLDGLYLKINMPPDAKPRYVKVPLKHDLPKNYWISPSGLDLAVIPLPPQVSDGADVKTIGEDLIVTPTNIITAGVVPGLIVQMLCMQPAYWSYPSDYMNPQNTPTIRMGHLSRLGFQSVSNTVAIRHHVIDIHSSPGNSGATVVVWTPDTDGHISKGMFLGIVHGFFEESDSYRQYQIPLSQTATQTNTISLVSAGTATTNRFVLAFKTIANPNLTDVIPVHELLGLKDSQEFLSALAIMAQNKSLYSFSTTLPIADKGKK